MKPNAKNIRHFFTSQYMLFSLILTIKAVLVHGFLFHDYGLIKAFIIEGCYIFLLLGFIEFLPKKARSYTYFIADGVITTLFASIVLYVAYFNTVPTYFALFQLGQVSAISDSVISLLNPLYLLMYIDIVILFIFRLSKKLPFPTARVNKKWRFRTIVTSVIIASIFFMYYKGVDIANPVLAAGDKGIFNYEILNIYKNPMAKVEPLDSNLTPAQINDKIRKIKGIEPKSTEERKMFGVAQGRNVIVIQGESFQDFLLNTKVNGQEITPNLNRLIDESLYFPNIYQQVGPGNTSDAEFIMNTSLFPQSYSATSISEGNRRYLSIPRLLEGEGYDTMTFHADEIKFWNRDQLYPALGFNHYYEQPLFEEKDIVGLGPSDDVLYGKGIDKLVQSKKPFYSMFVSLTAHHPYELPEDKQGLDLPTSYNDSMVGNYLQAQHYADAALGRFIADLKAKGIWQNSILLFYGDHFGLDDHMLDKEDEKILEALIGHPYASQDRYNIPLIITIPGETTGEIDYSVGGQLDFLPTLTNLLGIPIDNELVHFGEDLLNTNHSIVGMRYYMPEGSFISDTVIYKPNREFEDGIAVNLDTRTIIPKEDLKPFKDEYELVIELENLSDAYVLSLPHLIDTTKRP